MNSINFLQIIKRDQIIFYIFFIGVVTRIVPELISYPFPIGYDTINYYIPSIYDIQNNLYIQKLQIYPILLHCIHSTFGLSPHNSVILLSVICYGIFSIVIYLWSRKYQLSQTKGLCMTLFIIFQISVLRTGWDLHKDVLGLILFFVIFYIVDGKKGYKKFQIFLIFSLLTLIFFVDIMLSFLAFLSLILYFAIKRNWKYLYSLIATGIIILITFSTINTIDNYPIVSNIIKLLEGNITIDQRYSQINMLLLFLKVNILILPTFMFGLRYLKTNILYIPIILVLIGSFSWIVLPNTNLLLPDRWIILSGIFISIFSFAGMNYLVYQYRHLNRNNLIFGIVLLFFVIIGLGYMILPYDQPLPIYGIFREHTDFFIPPSMQFNSIDIKDNKDLIVTTEWINKNTHPDAKIYGNVYLKGWMKILLKDNRTFDFKNHMWMKKGIYIGNHDEIMDINKSFTILFSKGNFTIILNQ